MTAALDAPPVDFLHLEQWHLKIPESNTRIENRTSPHRQPPSVIAVLLVNRPSFACRA
jgi:hypothetical protein